MPAEYSRLNSRKEPPGAGLVLGSPRQRLVLVASSILTSLCLVSFFVSQQYVTSLPPSPFLVGRSIQSLSNNEVVPEQAPVNLSQDIEVVLTVQREKIVDDILRSYSFPGGRQTEGVPKTLRQLVPALGGKPLRSVIITTWRSGSTFLGDILNSVPGNFYHYEPLLDFGIVQVRGPPLVNRALRYVKQLLNCNYTDMDDYLSYGEEHTWLFTHNTRLWDKCLQYPHLCWFPAFLSQFCSLFPFQSMKLVRLRLSLVEELLADKLGVKILLVVRDPRGTMQSRRHRDWCPGQPDCDQPALLCADLVSDYSAAVRLKRSYPNNFRVIRYEDFSLDPHKGTEELFKYFGLDFGPEVRHFLDTHTKSNVGGVSSTYRDSKSAPFHWRMDLSYDDVSRIQRHCKEALTLWGYNTARNASHQHSFNPLNTNKFLLKV